LPGLKSTHFAGSWQDVQHLDWQDVQHLDSQVFGLMFIKENFSLLHFAVLCSLQEQNLIGPYLCHY
jgi:hypothetical protein